jgi:glycosyltransferase involved in cell wall biosynthesis
MLIAIDGNEANITKRVGVNQFAFQTLLGIYRTLQERIKKREIKVRVFLTNPPLDDLPPETDWWQYEVFGPKKFWTWTGLVKRLYVGKPKPDVIFSPSHYGPLLSPVPSVVSIMDLGFLRWPDQFTKKDFFKLQHMTKLSAKKAKKIITISEFSKKDIVDTYNLAEEKVVVAYPGFKKVKGEKLKVKSDKEVLKKYNINSKYILYLGTLKPSKNIDGLIKAFNLLNTNYELPATKLVIAGKKGWMYEDLFDLVKKLNLEDKVIFTGFVDDLEVTPLMSAAEVFVLPSYWEGFGIPALEAMGAETPVVCSKRGSLPEVVSKAALLVNPDNHDEIAEKISEVLTKSKLRQKLIKSGRNRVKKYSWKKCSDKILNSLVNI